MKTFIIDLPQSNWYYAAFYTAAFLASFIILVAEGRRRKIPQLPWLIVIATGFISFVFGCRMITYSGEDWNAVLSNQPLDHATGLVMLGGLAFCVPCILVAKRLVHLNESVLDAYAFVLPVGMCIQRIGCFLNGCCFGTLTSEWGVQYGQNSHAFHDHYMEAIIPPGSLYSIPIHPVQLYESLGCIIAIVVLWKVRDRFRSAGSLFYLSGLTYYVIRFAAEFFRDSNAYAIDVPVSMGLNAIQWSMLLLITASTTVIVVKERLPRRAFQSHNSTLNLFHLVYFFGLSIIFFFASKWLRPAEIFAVCLVLFTTAGYLLMKLFGTITVPGFRIASMSLILLSFLFMSQTYPEQAASDSTRISYNTISTGGLMGWQHLEYVVEDCDGNKYTQSEYKHQYRLIGLGFSRTVQTGKSKSYTLGLSAYAGKHEEEIVLGGYPNRKLTTYGINPYGQLDLPKFGLGLGVHVGDMTFIDSPEESSIIRYSVYPQAYLRFGRLHRFFTELSFARNFPSSFPGTVFQANLGFPLVKNTVNSGVFRIGTSSSTGIFLSASIPMGKHFVMEPYLGFLGSLIMMTEGYEKNNAALGSLSLHYKFSKKSRDNHD
jgi:prolipoprotein diacylglyceryltransferase